MPEIDKRLIVTKQMKNKVLVIQKDGFSYTEEDREKERLKMVEQLNSGIVLIPAGFTFKCVEEIDYIKTEEYI